MRYRIDGYLLPMAKISSGVLNPDGRSNITIQNKIVDLRISTTPTIHGKKEQR
jgi:type II secretory ATPase GspE/PulE/Tfp pilus assembly ATPase PilB-like protein